MAGARAFSSGSHPFRKGMGRFHDGRIGAALLVHVTTNAVSPTRAEVTSNGVLHVHLQHPKTNGRELNETLINYLAYILALPPEHIEVVAGHDSNGKVVAFYDINVMDLEQRLARHFGSDRTPTIW